MFYSIKVLSAHAFARLSSGSIFYFLVLMANLSKYLYHSMNFIKLIELNSLSFILSQLFSFPACTFIVCHKVNPHNTSEALAGIDCLRDRRTSGGQFPLEAEDILALYCSSLEDIGH